MKTLLRVVGIYLINSDMYISTQHPIVTEGQTFPFFSFLVWSNHSLKYLFFFNTLYLVL